MLYNGHRENFNIYVPQVDAEILENEATAYFTQQRKAGVWKRMEERMAALPGPDWKVSSIKDKVKYGPSNR